MARNGRATSTPVALALLLMAAPHVQAAIPASERQALIDLLGEAGAGEKGTECQWTGVSCDDGQTTVTEINLRQRGVLATLTTSLGGLTNLRVLDLGMSVRGGQVPAEIGSLSKLTGLWLDGNELSGPIPSQLGQLANLQSLDLGVNALTGPIPASLGHLTSLRGLWLERNPLSRGVPPELGDLENLTHLVLTSCHLTGPIPPELGRLRNLEYLDLGRNELVGSIPPQLGNLTKVQYVGLSRNQLSGSIPVELGGLARVAALELDNNRLGGPIPSSLGGLGDLGILGLSGNQLIGPVPTELRNLQRLEQLDFRWNALYTTDTLLDSFLRSRQKGGDWSSSQTLPPVGLAASVQAGGSVGLSWEPVAYVSDPGFYRIYSSASTGGPYTLVAATRSKADASWVDPKPAVGVIYLVVRTVTSPHRNNRDPIESGSSVEIRAEIPNRLSGRAVPDR
ncbi:MAG TPA: hypothetical protein PKL08_06395 [Thermoanaerobaculaceae bacterium]|nr:hypothetical protein [Thermoanaerobaculaceae bacterium]